MEADLEKASMVMQKKVVEEDKDERGMNASKDIIIEEEGENKKKGKR